MLLLEKAINYATNTKELYANNDEVTGLFSKNIRFINSENQPYYEYDLAKAKQTLEDDGYIYNENKAIYEKDGQSLQINLVIQVEEYPEWKTNG